MNARFDGPVQQVAGRDVCNQYIQATSLPGPVDQRLQATRQCPQCAYMTWAYNQHCYHCALDLWGFDRRANWEFHKRKAAMALLAIVFLGSVFWPFYSKAAEMPSAPALARKMAMVDAGRPIAPMDTSVLRLHAQVSEVSRIYRVTPERAADMAAATKASLAERHLQMSISDAFDWALLACERSCSEQLLIKNLAEYAAARNPSQTHHQTMRGLLMLKSKL